MALLIGRTKQNDRARANRMMRVDEERCAGAVAAENFQQAAVLRLRQSATTTFGRQAGTQDSQAAEAINHALWNYRLAVDGDRVDLGLAKAAQLFG